MSSAPMPPPGRSPRVGAFLFCLCAFGVVAWLGIGDANGVPQGPPETVGRIFGDDIAVKGALNVEVENGRSTTVLASGSDVLVRSGQARLELAEGGEIGICGPAHFSLLKSGGAVTLALDYGRIHARLLGSPALAIYTPLIVATPMAIGEARDATLGLETTGAMCIQTARGAMRVEQQLTGQAILVPQSGEVALTDGMLSSMRGSAGSCQCEILAARTEPAAKPPELSVPVSAEQAPLASPAEKAPTATNGGNAESNSKAEAKKEDPQPPAREEPVYKVLMPPLSFDAKSPAAPPGPSPETILLVRRVRVRPSVVYRGHVESAAQAAAPKTQPAPPAAQGASDASAEVPKKKEVSVVARIRNFFRRLWPGPPCAGEGCGGTAR